MTKAALPTIPRDLVTDPGREANETQGPREPREHQDYRHEAAIRWTERARRHNSGE